jgi:hypothetical protein
MEKVIVVFVGGGGEREKPDVYVERIRQRLVPVVGGLTVHISGDALRTDLLANASLYDARVYCAISAWIDTVEAADDLYEMLEFMPGDRAIYSVVESVPREYNLIDWRVGEPSPGVTLLALFRKKPGLLPNQFQKHWQNHSVLSLRIHPLSRYHRNRVIQRIIGPGEPWDGIVEERVGSIEDLAPERFYIGGAADQALAAADIAEFIDVRSGMKCNLLREFILKLPPWLEGHASIAASIR